MSASTSIIERQRDASNAAVLRGAIGIESFAEFVESLVQLQMVWLMVPAAIADDLIGDHPPVPEMGGILIDSENSFTLSGDDIRRASAPRPKGTRFVDVGTSGGIWGMARG